MKKPMDMKKPANMKKRLLVALLLVLIVALLPMIKMAIEGTSYVERIVSFRFSKRPQCTYAFDRFDEGKDYDVLKIYEIGTNIMEFEEYIRDSGWNPLPLAEDVLSHPLCKVSFDTNMNDMLSCTNGYWRWDEKLNELIIYDADKHIIYIRKASVIAFFELDQYMFGSISKRGQERNGSPDRVL